MSQWNRLAGAPKRRQLFRPDSIAAPDAPEDAEGAGDGTNAGFAGGERTCGVLE